MARASRKMQRLIDCSQHVYFVKLYSLKINVLCTVYSVRGVLKGNAYLTFLAKEHLRYLPHYK